MNRTVAKVAKILGADVSQVKDWARQFEEHLSAYANPPTGRERVFHDGDLLVLLHVQHRWKAEPDVESIKLALSRGEHREGPLVEHLYLHTPLLQEPPDDIDATWRHGVLLTGGARYGYLELARNYRQVAEATLRKALELDEVEEWAYPVLFAYRHALELYLKLIGEIDEVTHSLRRCLHLVETGRGSKLASPIREWILELDGIDPAGTAFRYADVGADRYFEYWFDLRHFQFAMERVFRAIDTEVLRVGAMGRPAKSAPRREKEP